MICILNERKLLHLKNKSSLVGEFPDGPVVRTQHKPCSMAKKKKKKFTGRISGILNQHLVH